MRADRPVCLRTTADESDAPPRRDASDLARAGDGRWNTVVSDFEITVNDSPASFPGGSLHSVSSTGSVFVQPEWLQLLDELDLGAVIGGQVELRYLVVSHEDRPVAMCPFMRCRGKEMYALYSLRRYYFDYLLEQAAGTGVGRGTGFKLMSQMVRKLGRALELLRCSLDDVLFVCNPLSYRAEMAIDPEMGSLDRDPTGAVVAALKRYAAHVRRPVCCLGVSEDDASFGRSLEQAGFEKVFLFYDNRLELARYRNFSDFLSAFPSRYRRKIRCERERVAQAGLSFRVVNDLHAHAEDFSRFYRAMYTKHSPSILHLPAGFWRSLQRALKNRVEAVLCEHDGRVVGYSVLLKDDAHREMWVYRGGQEYNETLAGVPFYFSYSLYQPIERAIEHGYDRLWLGPAGYETKIRRGAEQTGLWSYLWFPRRIDRWLLGRVLRRYGRIAHRMLDASTDLPNPLRRSDSASGPAR